MAPPFVEDHPPLLTSRIEFVPTARLPLPSIATRIEFTSERLAYRDAEDSQQEASDLDEGSSPVSRGNLARKKQTVRKIPKPAGEPGRPRSGGFCVESALVKNHGWMPEDFADFRKKVGAEARKKLNMTVSFRSQNETAIQAICDTMMKDKYWPELKKYENCWPVRSVLKLVLKYGSESSRRASDRKANERLIAALRGNSPA